MTLPQVPAVLVSTSVDTEAAALALADAVVADRLAACVHVAGPVTSIYRWQGAIERGPEWTCQIKTTPDRAAALIERIRAVHPYQLPEILVVPVVGGDPEYLAWLAESTAPNP
ncbi:MAG: cutA [Gemmatimonadetes bacterium]|nr:cutA [Gemmatimonadota bacterium]